MTVFIKTACQYLGCTSNHVAGLAMCGLCLILLLGCSPVTKRQSLEGTVTLDGKPLETGSIMFVPLPGTKSPTAGGDISQGRFSISPVGGTFAGTFRVEITAVRKTGKKLTDSRLGKPMDETVQFIPAQYNRNSRLTAEIVEQGSNCYEFALQSR